jgi:hypothetical protein
MFLSRETTTALATTAPTPQTPTLTTIPTQTARTTTATPTYVKLYEAGEFSLMRFQGSTYYNDGNGGSRYDSGK